MLVDPFAELISKGGLIVFKSSAFKREVLPPGLGSKVRLCECGESGDLLMGTVGGRLQLHVSGAGEKGEFRGHPASSPSLDVPPPFFWVSPLTGSHTSGHTCL